MISYQLGHGAICFLLFYILWLNCVEFTIIQFNCNGFWPCLKHIFFCFEHWFWIEISFSKSQSSKDYLLKSFNSWEMYLLFFPKIAKSFIHISSIRHLSPKNSGPVPSLQNSCICMNSMQTLFFQDPSYKTLQCIGTVKWHMHFGDFLFIE